MRGAPGNRRAGSHELLKAFSESDPEELSSPVPSEGPAGNMTTPARRPPVELNPQGMRMYVNPQWFRLDRRCRQVISVQKFIREGDFSLRCGARDPEWERDGNPSWGVT
jgi:hypothetical protein